MRLIVSAAYIFSSSPTPTGSFLQSSPAMLISLISSSSCARPCSSRVSFKAVLYLPSAHVCHSITLRLISFYFLGQVMLSLLVSPPNSNSFLSLRLWVQDIAQYSKIQHPETRKTFKMFVQRRLLHTHVFISGDSFRLILIFHTF